jgi:hypothetical protein
MCSMKPATMRISAREIPVDRLRERLAEDGAPAIHLSRDGDELVFSADTGPTMLRSRVLIALEDVAGERAPDRFEFAD